MQLRKHNFQELCVYLKFPLFLNFFLSILCFTNESTFLHGPLTFDSYTRPAALTYFLPLATDTWMVSGPPHAHPQTLQLPLA